MKKIIVLIQPFAPYQEVYVFENSNNREYLKIQEVNLPETLVGLSYKYDIYTIDMKGPKRYLSGVDKHIKEEEMKKYSVNKITVNFI